MRDVNAVLAAPRGRRFCWEVASVSDEDITSVMFDASAQPDDERAISSLAAALRRVDPQSTGALPEQTVTECLADAVALAWYWREPHPEDVLLAHPEVVAALAPLAESLLASDATRWWDEPVDLADQRFVQWLGEYATSPPELSGSRARLERSRTEAVAAEQEASRKLPTDPRANISGVWWSTPPSDGLAHTSRARPWLGAMQLLLTEDDAGWEHARVWPLRPTRDVRVFEITGPDSWAALVEAYPLRLTASRRHDWWRTTSADTEWFIPDWAAVANDYDAVHLTMVGYLTTPGTAVPVNGGATVLAGWNPDETYWLSDVLEPAGEPVEWERRDTGRSHDEWRPVPPGSQRPTRSSTARAPEDGRMPSTYRDPQP
ncbi:MAG TPA: hypothetical protein VIL34_04930 [Actinopolymorphaceae bacterium]|jgi:hypothetical protein